MMHSAPRVQVIETTTHPQIGNDPSEFTMIDFAKTLLDLKLDRRAVTALEYGLIAGVIVATIMVGFSILATSLSTSFSTIGDSL